MANNICLAHKYPKYGSSGADGSVAMDGVGSRYAAKAPVNGGSHDVEGWAPVENAANNTQYPRIPYSTGNFTNPVKAKYTDGSTSTWVTYHGGAGYAIQIDRQSDSLSDGEQITDDWSGATNHVLCEARAGQTWYTSLHCYAYKSGGTPSGANFSWWVFQVDSSGNWYGSNTQEILLNNVHLGSENNSSAGSMTHTAGLHGNTIGFSNRYNWAYSKASPFYNSSKYAFNFKVHDLPQSDYTFFECYFTLGNWANTDGLTMRLDMDNGGHSVQIDEITLRPVNISLSQARSDDTSNARMSEWNA